MIDPNKKRILFADDDEAMHVFLKKFFDQYGYECDEAYDGAEAVSLCEKNCRTYRFILLDLHMSGMNGADACVKIKEILKENKIDIPVLALSSDLSVERADEMKDVGFDEYLEKPIFPEEFKNMIDPFLS